MNRRALSPLTTSLALVAALVAATNGANAQTRSRNARTRAPVRQSPSPITLDVTPSAQSLHWNFTLRNSSGAPVEVVADRRLLRIEIQPSLVATTTASTRRGRTTRAPRLATCRAPSRPGTNEQANRVRLGPNEEYTEGFDVRDLCGIRLPAGFVPGALIQVRYGFDTARGFTHAIALDEQDPPVTDIALSTALAVPGDASSFPPAPPATPSGDSRVHVTTGGIPDAPSLTSLHGTIRVRLAGHYPLWFFNRPGQMRFEITSPRGEAASCGRGVRDYAPVRDFFVRVGPGRGLSETVNLAELCAPEQFAIPGVYRGQAVFETRTSGDRFGLQSFTGSAASAYFYFRITRGAQPGPYQRLPVADPFAPAPASSSSPSTRDVTSQRP